MKSNKKQWKEYFQDTTHSTFSLGTFFIRTLPQSRKESINKEFYAQRHVASTNLVPKPFFKIISPTRLFPSFIVEQKIEFQHAYKKTDKYIEDIGRTLKELHDYSRREKGKLFKYIPPDSLLANYVYDPLVILKVFVSRPLKKIEESNPKLVTKTVRENINLIEREVKKLARQTMYKEEYNCLVHGDLNETNVVRTKDGVSYLDWADCRWDIATCDVSQFIYLHKLTRSEQEIFLQAYNSPWITNGMIEIHRLLLVGWDIIYLMAINLEISQDKLDRLLPIKKQIWEKKKLFL